MIHTTAYLIQKPCRPLNETDASKIQDERELKMSASPKKVTLRDDNKRLIASGYLGILLLLFMGALFTVPIIIYVIAQSGLNIDELSAPITPAFIATVAAELVTIFIFFWYAGVLKQWKTVVGFKNFNYKKVLIGVGVGAFFFIGLVLLQVLANIAGLTVEDSDTSDMMNSLPGIEKYLMLFIGVSFIAPFVEELFFRGFIFSFLIRGKKLENNRFLSSPVLSAAIFSSSMFALMHIQGFSKPIDFIIILWTFCFAMASASLRFKTDSLYPSIAAHSFYNLLSAFTLVGFFIF